MSSMEIWTVVDTWSQVTNSSVILNWIKKSMVSYFLLFYFKGIFRVYSVSYRTCNLDSSILIVYFCKNHHLKLNEIFSLIIKFCYNVILYCYILIISFLHNLIVDGKASKVNLKWIIDFDERNHEKIIFIHCPNLALIKKCMFWRIHINFMQKSM